MTTYRRPKVYVPPYNYCDRWCERCRIDKSRCLLYQAEMDERLHREIDGRGEPTPDEMMRKMADDVQLAIRLVQEQAKEMGLDLEEAAKGAPAPREAREARKESGPMVRDGAAIAGATAAFLREHAPEIPQEAAVLRRLHLLPGPKLARAISQDETDDEVSTADAILQAQAAHRALGEMIATFEAAGKKKPALLDGVLELLALVRRLQKEIEEAWFSRPNALLESFDGLDWWGPLRDVTPTLRHLRK
jgi:hypothetical protein